MSNCIFFEGITRSPRLFFLLIFIVAINSLACKKTIAPDTDPPPPPTIPGTMPAEYYVSQLLGTEKDLGMIINDPINRNQYLAFGSKYGNGEMDTIKYILVKFPEEGGWLMHEFNEDMTPASTTTSTGHTVEYTDHNPGANTATINIKENASGNTIWKGSNVNMGDFFWDNIQEGRLRFKDPSAERRTASAEAIYVFSAVAGCGIGIASLGAGPVVGLLWGVYNTAVNCMGAYDAMKNLMEGKPAFGCFNMKDHANALSGFAETIKGGGGYGKVAMGLMPAVMNYYAQRSGQDECNQQNDSLPQPPGGVSAGDPHLLTMDGYYYDFQGWGEFIALQSTNDNFQIQVRQQQTNPYPLQVTFNTGIAVHTGQDIVCMLSDPLRIYVNNVLQDPSRSFIQLAGGASVKSSSVKNYPVWLIRTSANDLVTVRTVQSGANKYLDYSVHPHSARTGKVKGLLGNFDGNALNDLRLPGGQPVENKFESLYPQYANGWRINQANSLFYYASGENTETFTKAVFPSAPQQIAADKKAWAESTCKAAGITSEPFLSACILDVVATNDPAMAASLRWQQDILPDDFTPVDTTSILLNGAAQISGGILRLTEAKANQFGQAFVSKTFSGDFETEFSFRLGISGMTGADGLALVIAKNIPDFAAGSQVKMGYTGIPASLAIEFDNWPDGGEVGNHVAIHTKGKETNSAGYECRLAFNNQINNFADDSLHHVRIRYLQNKIEVYLDAEKILETTLDLTEHLGLNGNYFIGLTASTSSVWQTHNVVDWSWKEL